MFADGARASKDVVLFVCFVVLLELLSVVFVGWCVKMLFESLFIGYEDWVTFVAWYSDASKMVLMTASMDCLFVFWFLVGVLWMSEEVGSEFWMSLMFLGEVVVVCLGYYGASFSFDGDAIMVNSYGGVLY